MNKKELEFATGVHKDKLTESELRDPISVGYDYELYMTIKNDSCFTVKLKDGDVNVDIPRELKTIWGPNGAADLKAWLKDNHTNNMKDGLDYWFKKIDKCVEIISQ
nr:MAG TPA: hypothetical protein [Caudoviricetes sp.]